MSKPPLSKKRAAAHPVATPGTGNPGDAVGLESALLSTTCHTARRDLGEAMLVIEQQDLDLAKLLAANLYAVARASKLELEAQALREQVKSLQQAVPTGPAKGGQ